MNFLNTILQASTAEKIVAFILATMSVLSWGIALFLYRVLWALRRELTTFKKLSKDSQGIENLYSIVRSGRSVNSTLLNHFFSNWKFFHNNSTLLKELCDTELQKTTDSVVGFLPWLASIASAAPFIGLLGTVLGIIESFNAIAAAQNTQLAVVAPGLASALTATALGLITAIPASMMYNSLCHHTNRYESLLNEVIISCIQTLTHQKNA